MFHSITNYYITLVNVLNDLKWEKNFLLLETRKIEIIARIFFNNEKHFIFLDSFQ